LEEGGKNLLDGVIPPDEERSLAVFAKGGTAKVKSLQVFRLKSAWP